jgi:hypothetical protein
LHSMRERPMNLFSKLAGMVLAVHSVVALAAPTYEISGFHTELIFSDAVAQAELLGGVCQQSTSPREGGKVIARCDYLPCIDGHPADVCDSQSPELPEFTVAAQPISKLALEASGTSSRLTGISIVFEGNIELVAEYLKQEFGPPRAGPASSKRNWSHSRRQHWAEGKDHMGLLNTANMIMLRTRSGNQDTNTGKN